MHQSTEVPPAQQVLERTGAPPEPAVAVLHMTASSCAIEQPYMADLADRIGHHFYWFNVRKRIVVGCSIRRDGSLSNLELDHSSGDKCIDDYALLAVHDAAPFSPLPTGAPATVDMEMTFDTYEQQTAHLLIRRVGLP
jgi:TonB family protein